MRRPALIAAAFLSACSLVTALASGCAGAGESAGALLGAWSGEDAEAKRHTLTFAERGRATWAIEGQGERQEYAIRYALDDAVTPHHLDLSGFESGMLAGRTLYCIVELEGADAFRMDCEPGPPEADGAGGEDVRPSDFGEHTLLYMKVE